MGKLLEWQPTLLHVPVKKDVVYTPRWLSAAIVDHFKPSGCCLDPCRGDGAFFDFLPPHSRDYCEIEQGRDFFSFSGPVDWIIGNPPYSILLSWIRHSFLVADNVAYLIPLHRVFASLPFLEDVRRYGGVAEVLVVGTGTTAGFPFGYALGVVHYRRGFSGGTRWSYLDVKAVAR